MRFYAHKTKPLRTKKGSCIISESRLVCSRFLDNCLYHDRRQKRSGDNRFCCGYNCGSGGGSSFQESSERSDRSWEWPLISSNSNTCHTVTVDFSSPQAGARSSRLRPLIALQDPRPLLGHFALPFRRNSHSRQSYPTAATAARDEASFHTLTLG